MELRLPPEGPNADEDVAGISKATNLEDNRNKKRPNFSFHNADYLSFDLSHEEDQLYDGYDEPGHQKSWPMLWSGSKMVVFVHLPNTMDEEGVDDDGEDAEGDTKGQDHITT